MGVNQRPRREIQLERHPLEQRFGNRADSHVRLSNGRDFLTFCSPERTESPRGDMTPLRYLTPFVFLALLSLGAWLGGAWTLLAAAATPIGLMSLDVALGKDGASLPVEHGA